MTLLDALRAGTRDAHARVEDSLDVLHQRSDRVSYAQLLGRLRAVYAPLEREVDASPSTPVALPDWPARRKTPWLDADLADLGAQPRPDGVVPALTTVEDVVGAAYVMEGATLGGAVLLRGLAPGLPHRFLGGYGARRAAMWRDFRRHVLGLGGLDERAVLAAARAAFDAFERSCVGVVR